MADLAAEVANSQGAVVALLAAVLDGDREGAELIVAGTDPRDLVLTLTGSLLFALQELHGDQLRPALAGWRPGEHLGDCNPPV